MVWLEMQNCSLPQDAIELTVVLFCVCTCFFKNMYVDNVLMYACNVWKGNRAKGMLQTGVCLCKYVRLPDVTAEDVRVCAYMSVYFVFVWMYGLNVLCVWVSTCLVVCPWRRAAGI